MTETLLILAAMAPLCAVPLAVLSMCSGEPFHPEPELYELCPLDPALDELAEFIRRSIVDAFYLPPEMLVPTVHEHMRFRQLEHFAQSIPFDIGDDK
ncbi:hypothetical protein [Paraburkholderia phenoliruptrix]|uniref:hypothetical protein n=1 Tax=Paraburkholderia phenoliruptrix TaxID=252970 RepID=UPI001C6F4839|nr:hypothetical protein [Paraburkholderia phenoliruptrix]MBW9102926.1 hypothetical protein [Paraburkholderia phenoliruptrix]MBW9132900.1 hypothetical protein [Paraburkholderia ginsengiterrae]